MSIPAKIRFHLSYWSSQPRPVRAVTAYLLAKLGVARFISYQRNGSKIRMRSAGLARLHWAEPDRILDGEMFLSKILRKGDVVVDVGSNIGFLTLLSSRTVGSEGQVISIEAHPQTHQALLENLRLNRTGNVIPVNCAVGHAEGNVRFSDRPDDDWNRVEGTTGEIEVRQRRLDDVCESLERIDVLKIDVEGYELPVLQGSECVLQRTRCILLECWATHTEVYGYSPKEIIEFMQQRSFQGFVLHEWSDQVTLSRLSQDHEQRGLENYVFVKDPGILSLEGVVLLEACEKSPR